MIWFAAMHKVDTYFLALHHQTSRGFVEKPHYSMFHTPVQPWFFDQAAFHDAAREASEFARKPFKYDLAVRYRECAAGRRAATGVKDQRTLVKLLRELETRQFAVNLVEEDEPCAERWVLDFDDETIVANDGTHFESPEAAADFVAAKCGGRPFAYERGVVARDVVARRYKDGTLAMLNLRDDELFRNSAEHILKAHAKKLSGHGIVRVRTRLRGLPATLPAAVMSDMLFIVQESVTNAIKHGHAKNVILAADPAEGGRGFVLRIVNDGEPFDPKMAAGPESGHFGLSGMRERARRAGIRFSITTEKSQMSVRLEVNS